MGSSGSLPSSLSPSQPLATWCPPQKLGLVTSSTPGGGSVLQREANLGGLHQERSIPNKKKKKEKQTGKKKSPIKPHA